MPVIYSLVDYGIKIAKKHGIGIVVGYGTADCYVEIGNMLFKLLLSIYS